MLEWPIEYDGKTCREITVRRLKAAEVSAWLEGGDKTQLPMVDAPAAVIDFLDDDDALAVNKAIADFLPRRWQGDAQAPAT